MKKTWKESSALDKFIIIFSVIVSLAVVVFAILQIFNVWDKAINLCCPLLGVVMLCHAYIECNTRRKIAYFCTALFILVCSIIVFF